MSEFSGLKPSKANLRKFVASLEAIDFQQGELLRKELIAAVDKVRVEKKITKEVFDKVGINKIIKRHTNLSIDFGVDPSISPNAYVIPPDIKADNPIVKGPYKLFSTGDDANKLMDKFGNVMDGGIDLKRSKVSGVFAKIEIEAYVTAGLINSKKFTTPEVVAVMLHEIGHVFTYLEFLRDSVTTNYAILPLVRDWTGNSDKEYRLKLIGKIEKNLNLTVEDKNSLVAENSPENVVVVIIDAKEKAVRSNLGSNYQDMRSWEYLSDQFASRHGAAKDLAVALDKLMKNYRWIIASYMPNSLFLFLECCKVVKFISEIFIGITAPSILLKTVSLLFPIMTLLDNPLVNAYDDPEARIKRIRNQILERLKEKDLNKEIKRRLLLDIEEIDEILKYVKDKIGLYQYILESVTRSGKKFKRQRELQNDLEKLASNYLFAKAAKLQTLS